MKEYIKNLILAPLIFLSLYLIAINIAFIISRFIPGDPVLAYIPEGSFSESLYFQIYDQLGLNDPLIVQYYRYLWNMFSFNWGFSQSIVHGMPVMELIALKIPQTLDLFLIPVIISIILGFYLGKHSLKRTNAMNRLTQISTLTILAMSIIIIGMGLQFLFGIVLQILPVTGSKSPFIGDPPFVTGFRFIDSMLSGQWQYIPDYLIHLILPWTTLIITMLPLMIFLTRTYFINKNSQSSLLIKSPYTSTMAILALGYGMVMTSILIVEIIFGFNGFGNLLITSITNRDYWVINAYGYIIPLIFTFIITGCSLLLALYNYRKQNRFIIGEMNEKSNKIKINSGTEINEHNQRNKFGLQLKELAKYLKYKLKSPYTLIGLGIIIFVIIVSIFPFIVTPYSYDDAIGVFTGSWGSPSPDHPLGQAKFGRDVLARIIYALPNSLINITMWVGIGLLGGLIFGIPFNLIKNRYKIRLDGIMIPLFIIPLTIAGLFAVVLFGTFAGTGPRVTYYGFIFEISLIPIFTIMITQTKFNATEIGKQLISYIPLVFGFVLLADTYLGFLGFSDSTIIQLGNEISEARLYFSIAPWATLYPGIALFVLLLGFFLVYAGFREIPLEIQEIQQI